MKRSRAAREYAGTFVTEAVVVASALLVYRLIAQRFGTDGFAEYAIGRRTLTLLLPFGALGMDVAVARYVALNIERARAYALSSLIIATAGVVVTGAALLTFSSFFARLLFGSEDFVGLVRTLPVLLAGAALHVLAYGNLRGRRQIPQANLLMLLNHGLLPLAALQIEGQSVTAFLAVLGAAWMVGSGLALLVIRAGSEDIRQRIGELSRYGLKRVPGDFAQLLFFALPMIATAHLSTISEAGIVAFGVTAIGLVGSTLTPISFVLLPVAAGMLNRGANHELRQHVLRLATVSFPLLIIGVLTLEIFANQFVGWYLGPEFVPTIGVLRLMMLGAVPWGVYIILRSIIDARHTSAVNAQNVIIGLALFVLLAAFGLMVSAGVTGVLIAFVCGLYLVGFLTALEAYRILAR